jgi:hypothetical protein
MTLQTFVKSTHVRIFLAFAFLFGTPALPQAQQQGNVSDLELAREAVLAHLRSEGQSTDGLRIEIVGQLDHARLHKKPVSVAPGEAVVVGRLVNEAWQPIARAEVSITARGFAGLTVKTDATGGFQATGLNPGPHHIEVRVPDGPSAGGDIELVEGLHRVITRDAGSRLVGTLLMPGPTLTVRALAVRYNGTRAERLMQVELQNGRATVINRDKGGTKMGPLIVGDERANLQERLRPFFETWLDVARGPDRFKALLAEDIACGVFNNGQNMMPTVDPRRCATFMLEMFAFGAWFEAEGMRIPQDEPVPGSIFHDQYTGGKLTGLEELAARSEGGWARIRAGWRLDGFFDNSHQMAVRPFLRVLLGEGGAVRQTTMNKLWEELGNGVPSSDPFSVSATRVKSRAANGYWIQHPSGCDCFFFLVPKGRELQLQLVFMGSG